MRRTAERVGHPGHTFCFIASTIIHRSSITDRLIPRAWRRGRDDGEPATLLERNINTAKRCRLRRSGAETIWDSRLLLSTRRAGCSSGNGQRREPALCQLYQHTFVPYQTWNWVIGSVTGSYWSSSTSGSPGYHLDPV